MSAVTPLRPYPGVLVPPVMATARLFRTDMARSFAEPLELAFLYAMDVVCNPDAEHTRIAHIDIVHPDAIRPLVDYVSLDVLLRDVTRRTMTVPMGHYLADVPERTYDGRKLSGRIVGYGTAPPTTATWSESFIAGDTIINTAPTAGGVMGWVCTASGTPGTWKSYGEIAS